MYVVTLDTARTSLVDMFLSADNFEEYHCDQDEIIAGINISNTFKLLKTITNNDVLKIEINSKEYMNIEITSESKRRVQLFNSNSWISTRVGSKCLKLKCLRLPLSHPQTFSVSVAICLTLEQILRLNGLENKSISVVKETLQTRTPLSSVPRKVRQLQDSIVLNI